MHADALYHRMLDQEKEIEAAKAEGRPVPVFPSLLSTTQSSSAKSPVPLVKSNLANVEVSDINPKLQAQLKERLKGLEGAERELEERAIKAELDQGLEVAKEWGDIMRKQDDERATRKEQGKQTLHDRFIELVRFK